MRQRITQLEVPLDHTDADVAEALARKLGCEASALTDVRVVRRSLDARARRREPVFILTVEIGEAEAEESTGRTIAFSGRRRPVVVGAGPAGLMAALTLAEARAKPLIIERGAPARERAVQVTRFWTDGTLDVESNVLFGEGGAGLFSDGKLTARSKDRERVRKFLETLVACGAPRDILIDAEPHLGSDVLAHLVPALRERITSLGGEVRFHARLDNLIIEDGALRAVAVNGETVETDACVLATGHSARDVYRMLTEAGVRLEAKPFAVGLRLELPQAAVDRAQYGKHAGHPRLGAASFRLTRKPERDARACYTFCMCPGGSVIACASSAGELTTNGMSLSRRSGAFANAAFLVPVHPDDAADGIAFQSTIERAAFEAGGGDYALPAQPLTDFLEARTPTGLPETRSCPNALPVDLRTILPEFVTRTLTQAIPKMLKVMKGVNLDDALLYAAETRSSSPVRVVRDGTGQSPSAAGLFPAGEGAGYAGGIVSSAVDGLRAADALIQRQPHSQEERT